MNRKVASNSILYFYSSILFCSFNFLPQFLTLGKSQKDMFEIDLNIRKFYLTSIWCLPRSNDTINMKLSE